MNFTMIMGIVRTIAASVGGSAMVTSYFETGEAWMGFVGAVIVIATGVFSVINKQKVGSELAAAKAAPAE